MAGGISGIVSGLLGNAVSGLGGLLGGGGAAQIGASPVGQGGVPAAPNFFGDGIGGGIGGINVPAQTSPGGVPLLNLGGAGGAGGRGFDFGLRPENTIGGIPLDGPANGGGAIGDDGVEGGISPVQRFDAFLDSPTGQAALKGIETGLGALFGPQQRAQIGQSSLQAGGPAPQFQFGLPALTQLGFQAGGRG